MANLPNRVALVYDWANKWGGAERVLLALHDLFPQAPLYTAVYNPQTASWAKAFPRVVPSFLQSLPLARTHHEYYPWLMPLAFESLDFGNFDLVISVTSAFAKGIITKPTTWHICYCLTPPRYLWSHAKDYSLNRIKPMFDYLKYWDQIAAQRPDRYIAISQTVQKRIKEFYGVDSEVVYPPVAMNTATISYPGEYFLWVGRMVSYKRLDAVVETFNQLNLPLVIVGTGHMEEELKNKARSNIKFVGSVSDEELKIYYQKSKAVIYFHEEDFGLVPVEAMATGKPVIAWHRGGVAETIVHGITGLLGDDLAKLLKEFDQTIFDAKAIIRHAQRFSLDRFKSEFLLQLEHALR